jgi:microcystin-dependent protein
MNDGFELQARQGSVGEPSLDPNTVNAIAAKGTTPIGSFISIGKADTNPPAGYLYCDGRAISRIAYADLFAVIGTKYGVGDGSSTFNLPNFGLVGEPSLGTMHPHGNGYTFCNQACTVAGSPYDFDLSSQVPVGTTAVYITGSYVSGNAGCNLSIRNSAGQEFAFQNIQVNGLSAGFTGIVKFNSDYKVRVVVINQNATLVIIAFMLYFI